MNSMTDTEITTWLASHTTMRPPEIMQSDLLKGQYCVIDLTYRGERIVESAVGKTNEEALAKAQRAAYERCVGVEKAEQA